MIRRQFLAAGLLGAAGAALGGCVTLLPKVKPIQMYRFGFDPSLGGAPVQDYDGPVSAVALSQIYFAQDSQGDRLLTREGAEVSYIADARWSVGAVDLYSEAVVAAFAHLGRRVRLETRPANQAHYRLDLNVLRFEVSYERSKPTVATALQARLLRLSDRVHVAEKTITRDVPVARNHVSDIVAGYDLAVSESLTELVHFVEHHAPARGG